MIGSLTVEYDWQMAFLDFYMTSITMTFEDLDTFDQYYLEVAKKELAKAVTSQT